MNKNNNQLNVGICGKERLFVTEQVTAKTLGSGDLDVFATPALVALMENTAKNSILLCLADSETTVGTKISVQHTAATPLGMEVWCESKLMEMDRRRLTFSITAYDATGEIGTATHERFIVDKEKFVNKANEKLSQS